MNNLDTAVAACQSWEQLLAVAWSADTTKDPDKRGIYCSNNRFCSAEGLHSRLQIVMQTGAPLQSITRRHGFRAKAAQLLRDKATQAHAARGISDF